MENEIKAAAKWWADQLRSKPKHDNGDGFHNALMSLLAERITPLPESEIQKFQDCLEDVLKKNEYIYCVSVDYGACGNLASAADAAGINIQDRLPVKTNMWIEPGKVKVSCGYRAPIEVIYEAAK